jgi:exopolyphosphatase/guanosine-5'-triphosphate,3'-diphosphate pyrophosphatase
LADRPAATSDATPGETGSAPAEKPARTRRRGAQRTAGQVPPRIGIVDIGSNSVRLVVFNVDERAPVALFNEKVLCGLGRGLEETGRLHAEGVELALATLGRFAGLARAMQVQHFDLLATAAVRDARNGSEFVERVEARCGVPVRVLDGGEEARLSAQGVVSAIPTADGLTGDLGGGSLEVTQLDAGKIGRMTTLPLGPLRLMSDDDGNRTRAVEAIERHLDAQPWLAECEGRAFYPVGGAWRALARIHVEQHQYPLHMIHGYKMSRKDAEELGRLIGQLGKRSLARMPGVPRRRLETLPYAGLLLERLLQRARPSEIVFSANGLREGWLYERLPQALREQDPLIAASRDWALRDGRFGDLGEPIAAWTDAIFPNEPDHLRRLRRVASHLSDIAWREHPDYRAQQALYRVLRAPQLYATHDERLYLAYALSVRYGGVSDPDSARLIDLLDAKDKTRAESLGHALRLAYAVSAGTAPMLERSQLEFLDGELFLYLPDEAQVPSGQVLERRLDTLGNSLGAGRTRVVG